MGGWEHPGSFLPASGVLELRSGVPRPVYGRPIREEYAGYPGIIARLNNRWRIIEGKCGLQWILQSRKGESWRGRRFHTERDALLRSIRETKANGGCFTVGEVNEIALRAVEALPERHA